MIDEREVIDDVELHLLNEWHLRCARERRQEKALRQVERFAQDVKKQRSQPNELHYLLASAVLVFLSVIILFGNFWG